ncbi:hypothetical protein [uncultured Clostridium sp.]|uniref:hypothetical protein n=1 Tax=uncultured Clostridium sp. TaxID=59620 RepID=UPI003216A0DA
MAIKKDITVTVENKKSIMSDDVWIYQGDKNIDIYFAIIDNRFEFSTITPNRYSFSIRKPDGNILPYTDIIALVDNKVKFTITEAMADELNEVGIYDILIHLYDDLDSRISIPEISFEVKQPLVTTNALTSSGFVESAVLDSINDTLERLDANGNYVKTVWNKGDVITKENLNKIENQLVDTNSQLADIVHQVDNFSGTDTIKLQKAINASSGKTLKLKDDTTYVIDSVLNGVSNIKIIGRNSTIKVKDNIRILSMFNFNYKSNIEFDGVIFDMNMQNMPLYQLADYPTAYNVPIHTDYCGDIIITNCKFVNLYNKSLEILHSSGNIKIKNNYFSSPVQTQNQILDHISMVGISTGNLEIENNFIDNAPYTNQAYGINGIFMANISAPTKIKNNTLLYCGRDNTGGHRLHPIDFYGICKNIEVEGNIIVSVCGCVRFNSCQYMKFKNNTIKFTKGNAEISMPILSQLDYGIDNQTKAIEIENNKFISLTTEDIYLIGVYCEDWGLRTIGVSINNNKFFGKFKYIMKLTMPVSGFCFKNNEIYADESGNAPQTVWWVDRLTNTMTETLSTEILSTSEGIEISNNKIVKQTGSNDILLQVYTGVKKEIRVSNNDAVGIGTNSGLIHIHTTKCYLSNNSIKNASLGYYLRGVERIYAMNNVTETCTTGFNIVGATSLIKVNNYADGALI